MASSWIFGIDGGGTSARLRVEGLDGSLLFYGEGGSTNLRSNPRDVVVSNLVSLFSRARAEAGLELSLCKAGFAGSAGVDREADRGPFASLVREALEQGLGAGVVTVSEPGVSGSGAANLGASRDSASRPAIEAGNDAEPALAGALGDVEGFLLIAGTGSIAYGRTRAGDEARAGGWGHLLGDEGSAFWIAFEAIKRSLRSHELRDLPTGLFEACLEFFGLEDLGALVPFTYERFDKTGIGRFARVVGQYRDKGDELALDIFRRGAKELAATVASVDARVGAGMAKKRLAFRGGIIEADATYRNWVSAEIKASSPGIEIVPAMADAARGACLLARGLVRT